MPANEESFTELASVPVYYDRLSNESYGNSWVEREFFCRNKLKAILSNCMEELFLTWSFEQPVCILSAGTLGDGENAHGKGLAFDLDGFIFDHHKLMMDSYPENRIAYIGVNAHLYLYFSQVLAWHYQGHKDHFHVDFNFSNRFVVESTAKTAFLQSVLKYVFDCGLGDFGEEKDGVDGNYGSVTRACTQQVLSSIGLAGRGGLTRADVWRDFLQLVRVRAFDQA